MKNEPKVVYYFLHSVLENSSPAHDVAPLECGNTYLVRVFEMNHNPQVSAEEAVEFLKSENDLFVGNLMRSLFWPLIADVIVPGSSISEVALVAFDKDGATCVKNNSRYERERFAHDYFLGSYFYSRYGWNLIYLLCVSYVGPNLDLGA